MFGKPTKPPAQSMLPPAKSNRMSEAAASVQQYMTELEDALDHERQSVRNLTAQISGLQSQLNDAQAELTHSRNECDHYRRLYVRIQTKLETAGELILNALRPDLAKPTPGPDPIETVEAEIANLIPQKDSD